MKFEAVNLLERKCGIKQFKIKWPTGQFKAIIRGGVRWREQVVGLPYKMLECLLTHNKLFEYFCQLVRVFGMFLELAFLPKTLNNIIASSRG